jgi:predicted dehydrogenase
MMRVGLVGAGDAGRHHARALAAAHREGLVAWTAVGGRDVGKLEARRGELGLPDDARVVSTDELLAGGACDAAIVATPDGLHHAHASRALAAGLHVLVEKPIALAVAHAEALVAAARAADRVLAVGYHLRHHPGHELVHARRAELVGAIRTVYIRWAWPDPAVDGWRARGDGATWWSLAALGTHGIDLALWLVDEPVADVACVREPARGIDRAAEVSLRFAGGALAHISCAVSHRATSVLAIAGDAGEVEARGTLGARGAGTISGLPFEPADPYVRQLRAFAARCAGAGPRIDPHAVSNLQVLHRIQPS